MHKDASGLMVAMFTPMHTDETIWPERVEASVDRLRKAGCDGAFALGSAGEFFTLNPDERYEIAQATAKAGAGMRVWVGVSSVATRDAIAQAKRLANLPIAGISAVNAYYVAQRGEDMYRHFMDIAEASEKPMLLYNIPARTGAYIPPEVFGRLVKNAPNIVGVKDSSGNPDNFKAYLDQAAGASVICGSDGLIVDAVSWGAAGVVSAPANICPAQYARLYKLAKAGELEEARALWAKIAKLLSHMGTSPAPDAHKRATCLAGFDVGPARRPLYPLSEAEDVAIQAALSEFEKEA